MGSPITAMAGMISKAPAGKVFRGKAKAKGGFKGGLLPIVKDTAMGRAGLIDKIEGIEGKTPIAKAIGGISGSKLPAAQLAKRSPLNKLAKATGNDSVEEVAKEVASNSSDLFKRFSATERMKSAAKENSSIAEAMNVLSGYLGK